MHDDALAPYREALRDRALPDGSFAVSPGSASRPDATAWAAVALCALDAAPDVDARDGPLFADDGGAACTCFGILRVSGPQAGNVKKGQGFHTLSPSVTTW